jgi:hypothetical protein
VRNVTYNLGGWEDGSGWQPCCLKEDAKMKSLRLLLLLTGLSALVVPLLLPAAFLSAQAQQCPNGICP